MSVANAQALYFGEEQAPLFGWLHAGVAPAGFGVVLCSAFGREEISAHRSWRALADMLAHGGWPTLRFDLACTGDSAGDMLADDAPSQWRDSVHAAATELRRLTGVSQVVLVGLRAGAMLAWQVGTERDDVAGLACIAPVLSGRAWLRELKTLEATSQGDAQPSPAGLFEAGGFAMSEAARDVVAELDLRRAKRAPRCPVLLLDRSELPALAPWAAELAAQGMAVQHHSLPGFSDLMLDPHRALTPHAMWDSLRDWLASLPADAVDTADTQHPPARTFRTHATWGGAGGVQESAVAYPVLGGCLNAVVSEPANGEFSGRTLLWLNAGATRRIGPSRLHVDLARRWARLGHRVVRLDLSGLGDSPALPGQPDTVVYAPSAVQEVSCVIEQLRAQAGTKELSVLGLCSGAFHGFKAAVHGAAVDRVVAINPLTFFWREGMALETPLAAHKLVGDISRYRSGIFDASRWQKLFGGGVDLKRMLAVLWISGKGATALPLRELARVLHLPVRDDLAAELRSLAQRKVRLTFMIAGGDSGEVLLRHQAGRIVDRLTREGALKLEHFESADHVFSRHLARQALTDALNHFFNS